MKIRALAALAAGAALTACGSHAASTTAAATPAPAETQSCHQQYLAWKTGPAKAKGKQLARALDSLQSAGDDLVLMSDGLKRAARIAHQLQAYPMPVCADPAAYWKKVLAGIRAGGDNASTSTGLSAVILAEAPLKKVPSLENKLTAELKTTTR